MHSAPVSLLGQTKKTIDSIDSVKMMMYAKKGIIWIKIFSEKRKVYNSRGSKVSSLGGDSDGAFHLQASTPVDLCIPGKSYLTCVRLFLDIIAKSINNCLYFTAGYKLLS